VGILVGSLSKPGTTKPGTSKLPHYKNPKRNLNRSLIFNPITME